LAVREAARADPEGFVATLGRATVIDEVQRVPELLLAVKSRLDRDRRRGQFLLTGSANLRRIPAVADALPGRVDYLTLWPLTQGEIAGRPDRFMDRAFADDVPMVSNGPVGRHAYLDAVLAGGFPEALERSGASRMRFFASYIASIVDRDVADAAPVHDPESVGTAGRAGGQRPRSSHARRRAGRGAV
jgi:predicted AAA+ superfamily ATPase